MLPPTYTILTIVNYRIYSFLKSTRQSSKLLLNRWFRSVYGMMNYNLGIV